MRVYDHWINPSRSASNNHRYWLFEKKKIGGKKKVARLPVVTTSRLDQPSQPTQMRGLAFLLEARFVAAISWAALALPLNKTTMRDCDWECSLLSTWSKSVVLKFFTSTRTCAAKQTPYLDANLSKVSYPYTLLWNVQRKQSFLIESRIRKELLESTRKYQMVMPSFGEICNSRKQHFQVWNSSLMHVEHTLTPYSESS